FVGQAGRLLDELLLFIGFNRNDVFIANVLKCRPPENRDPGVTEINTCKNYLFRQIEIINPIIICTMGRYSKKLVLDTSANISKLRGKIFKIGQSIVLPINHPAAALYTPSKLQVLREDFKKIKDIFDNYENPGAVGEITVISGLKKMDKSKTDKTRAGEARAGEATAGNARTDEARAGEAKADKYRMDEEVQVSENEYDERAAKDKNQQLGLF
ncbi:MAG: hypothetical protein FJW56_08480, partial [Actinobacteria bacterium]|nr:hypothetical protein [Actinomycetota bacterium]